MFISLKISIIELMHFTMVQWLLGCKDQHIQNIMPIKETKIFFDLNGQFNLINKSFFRRSVEKICGKLFQRLGWTSNHHLARHPLPQSWLHINSLSDNYAKTNWSVGTLIIFWSLLGWAEPQSLMISRNISFNKY